MIIPIILGSIGVLFIVYLYGHDRGYKSCAKKCLDEDKRHEVLSRYLNENQLRTEKPERSLMQ